MGYGVTETGFNLKRLTDISAETDSELRASLGDGINLSETSPLGQIKAIMDERLSLLWELAQSVYNSQYPNTASDTSLDNVVSITGVVRLPATKSSVTARVFGDLNTIVPAGFQAAVAGNETAIFESSEDKTIHAGINEVQTISFSATPSSGSFKLRYDEIETSAISHTANAAALQTALRAISGLGDVTVTGSFSSGFVVTFAGGAGEIDQPLLSVTSNSLSNSGAVSVTVTETTKGYSSFVDIPLLCTLSGSTVANAASLTVIKTPTSGVESVTNLLDAAVGRDVETDSALKLRRLNLLQRAGTATLEGIKNKILAVTDVIQAILIENVGDEPDEDDRPAKSFQAYVLGGSSANIAKAIWDSKPAGIEAYGDISQDVVDSQGLTQTIKFSRPNSLNIYMVVNVVANSDENEGEIYPENGDQQIKDAIIDFVQGFKIGQDVIVNRLYTPVNTVPGVIGLEILIGTSASPTESDNIPVSVTEIAVFDSSRITVSST